MKSVSSRSSVSEYILIDQSSYDSSDTPNYVVETAIVEGEVIVNPYGIKTSPLHLVTNQVKSCEKEIYVILFLKSK